MKTQKVIILAAFLTLFGYANIFAQEARVNDNKPAVCTAKAPSFTQNDFMKSLSAEQQEQVKAIRLETQKETTPLKAELKVLRAELDKASIGDKVNASEVNNLIDKISKLQGELMKIRYAKKQKVRSILTDEQKIMFDAKGFGEHKKGKGMHGQGQCPKGMKGDKQGNRHSRS